MKIRKLTAVLAAAALGGSLALVAMSAPASATETCVPRDAVDAYTEVVVDVAAYDETVEITPASEARWVNYSWNGGPIEGDLEPVFPGEGWQASSGEHGGHPQPSEADEETGLTYNVSHGESGKSSWFHWDFEPAVDAVTEIVHHEAVTHTVEHEAISAIVCEEEPVEVTPRACASVGDWYTEGDDVAPTESNDGLVFAGGSGDAVGIRVPVTGNLQGWAPVTYAADGALELFYFRIVVDASADGGASYSSLTVTSGSPVTSDSVAYSNKLGESHTLAEFAELWPNAVITSVGFHLDSAAPADAIVILAAASGGCASFDWTSEPPVVTPEPTPTPTEPAPVSTATPAAATPVALAETGFDAMWLPYAAAALLVAGLATVVIRRRSASKHDG